MRILIIEDEQPTALRLQGLIAKYDESIEVCGMLSSITSAISWFRDNTPPDLIFQDILLSDGNCFEIYETIRISTPVIFTTAYSEYALRSFEVNSIDYLVKPYDLDDIRRVLDKFSAFESLFSLPDISLLKELLTNRQPAPRRRFLVRLGDNYKTLDVQELAYILYEDGLAFAYTLGGQKHALDQSLSVLTNELDPHNFCRINRFCIVNSKSIKKISSWFNGRLKLELDPTTPKEILVSRERVKAFKQWLDR